MLYKNYTTIITRNNLNQPSASPSGHRVVGPELLLCCSIVTPSVPMTAPPLTAHFAGSSPHVTMCVYNIYISLDATDICQHPVEARCLEGGATGRVLSRMEYTNLIPIPLCTFILA